MKNKRVVVFGLLAFVLFVLGLYFSLANPRDCLDLQCFRNSVAECSRAVYFNEDADFTWRYEILRETDGMCDIEVTLLQTKVNGNDLARLSGQSMTCSLPKGIFDYPEKQLSECHGRLKESFQEIIIERLHSQVLNNIGEIDDSLDLFFG